MLPVLRVVITLAHDGLQLVELVRPPHRLAELELRLAHRPPLGAAHPRRVTHEQHARMHLSRGGGAAVVRC